MIYERNCKILEYIVENPGLKGIELARIFKMNCSSMLIVMHKFEKIGLIRREKNGRTKRIFVTEKGKEIFINLYTIKDKWR